MESLYAKLYDKYDKLKRKKLGELDEINKDQELKFINYVSAAEELIEYLKTENKKLQAQVNNLRSEVDSIRLSNNEQCLEYQKLLMEENQKNKALSEEVERLLQEGIASCSKDAKHDNVQLTSPDGAKGASGIQSSGSPKLIMTKRRREFESEREGMVRHSCSGQDDAVAEEPARDLSKKTLLTVALVSSQLPECCERTINTSGEGVNGRGQANCLFQAIVEHLVDMKLSSFDQTEGMCISALHQSSGYSFSLTWVRNKAAEEPELLYRVLSLGTFERVAPVWMKEVIMFSVSMCPIFFQRIAAVIKLHH